MAMATAIHRLAEKRDLNADEMRAAMQAVMGGEATQAQIGAFLMGLRLKGETVEEIAAAARVMRSLATPVRVTDSSHLVDTCGTGGDGAGTFNISTASAFVVAAAGGRVAKHGNRSVSSKSGSADLLEAAGVNLELSAEQVGKCIDQIGVGFMFAPRHHSAMKHAIGPRRELGMRTIFNVLGPLTNPAGALCQVLGVFSRALVVPMADVLRHLGSRHVFVVHASDGLDEFTISGETFVAELRDGTIREYTVQPEQFGLKRAPIASLTVNNAQESLARVRSVLADEAGPARDIVVLNAGAAIYAAGLADSLQAGIVRAQAVIANGAAAQKLADLVRVSRSF